MSTNKLIVCETFETIQGEGKLAGKSCMFIRLMKCGMNCSFCDTKFTWKPGVALPPTASLIELEDKTDISNFLKLLPYVKNEKKGKKNVVISGGEPLIESNFPLMKYLVEYLVDRDIHITFETTTLSNPVVDLNSGKNIIHKLNSFRKIFNSTKQQILFSISPKFPASCYPQELIDAGNLMDKVFNYYTFEFNDNHAIQPDVDYYYKFVYHPSFEKFIDPVIDKCLDSGMSDIYLMPLTPNQWKSENQEQYKQTCLDTAEYCKLKNVSYSPRIHTDLWGLATGV